MRTMVLHVERGGVLSRVRGEVEYLGAKRGTSEADLWGLLRAADEDGVQLGLLFDDALLSLRSSLSPYLVDTLPKEMLLLRVPLNFDRAQEGVLVVVCGLLYEHGGVGVVVVIWHVGGC